MSTLYSGRVTTVGRVTLEIHSLYSYMTIDERWMKILERAQANGWYTDTKFVLSAYDGSIGSSMWLIGTFNDDGHIETWHRDIETLIFQPYFAKALWKNKLEQNECNCNAVPGEEHRVDCASQFCPHCKGRIHIVNPSGYCSHIHYPEDCKVCMLNSMTWEDHLQEMVLANDYLKYIEGTL